MRKLEWVAVAALVAGCLTAPAKDKKKSVLPADVLAAETVLVLIDPQAGMSLEAPTANRDARDAVEKALLNWGRFRMTSEVSDADLVVVVRKGNGRIAQPTIGGIPQNNRPVIMQPSDAGVGMGGHSGIPAAGGDPTGQQPSRPTGQVETGPSEDMFSVYRGKRDHALDAPPVWRYYAKDGLRSPGVPAVDEFRRAVVESEKQLGTHP